MENFDSENAYNTLKNILDSIKKDIQELTRIKKSLSIFQKERYLIEIRNMVDNINKLESIKIKEYNSDTFASPLSNLKNLATTANKVDLVKDFLLFKVIYENTKGKNQEERFELANTKLEEIKKLFEPPKDKGNKENKENKEKIDIDKIYNLYKEYFDIIKKKLINNEKRSEAFLQTFKKYFNIKENEENKDLIEDLNILFNSKKYELELESIIYFFNCLNKDDEWIKDLSKKIEKLSEKNLTNMKTNLKELKNDQIYDYQTKNNYFKIFTSLYGKKEAIDFLQKKINININELYERIDPNSPTITIQKLDDTKKCIKVFNQFEAIKNNKKIFEYIKSLKDDEIKAFESYSKIYLSIIELDRNYTLALNIFDQVNGIIKSAKFLFQQDTEFFYYGDDEKKTSMEELIHLKNKINISAKGPKKKEEEKNKSKQTDTKNDKLKEIEETIYKNEKEKKEKEKKDLLKIKLEKLIFYKNLITNMEVIYENMQTLRTKGNNLPIDIKIIVQYDKKNEADYYLDQKESSFEQIEIFLLSAKDDYKKILESAYKEKTHIRYLYGKLFKSIIRYLDGGSLEKVIDIFRFILNKNNDDVINTSNKTNPQIRDYVKNYTDYDKKSFENIFNYLIKLFEANNTTLQKQYEKILIKEEKTKYKGIFLHESEDKSIGKFIYDIFVEKIGQKPIAQNILISSKETSIEEIQAFLYRSILCDYNTLFVVEINESLSDYQQGIMYNYLDELLLYKMDKYKSVEKGVNIQKEKTNGYLDACIIFI